MWRGISRSLLVLVLPFWWVATLAAQPAAFVFGQAAAPLNGPWKFHLGDDLRWAEPGFDDASWETMDLTPHPGAHDGDVGLTNYTPGWTARGHRGYTGFAWYRMKVRVADPGVRTLWLAGPAMVDSAYQLYVNGQLLGGIGDFSRSPPEVIAIKPRLYPVPSTLWSAEDGDLSAVIAVRVVALKGTTAPDGGGMQIAPVLGNEVAVRDHYRLQWLQKIEGYVVDATEPVFFLILALMALSMIPFDPRERFNLWIAAVLVLLGAAWLNQPLFWLGQFETFRDYVVWRITIIEGLLLGAWVMAWRAAFRVPQPRWTAWLCTALTILYLIVRPMSTPILWPALPPALIAGCVLLVKVIRLAFLALLVIVVALGCYRRRGGLWAPLLAVIIGSISVFSREVGQLGVPGIWFPYGVGVSRTEYANAAFAVALLVYLLQRLWRYAPAVRAA